MLSRRFYQRFQTVDQAYDTRVLHKICTSRRIGSSCVVCATASFEMNHLKVEQEVQMLVAEPQ
jgi:hypothetical protein